MALTSIPDPRREDIEKWLTYFVGCLREEFGRPGTPIWYLNQVFRDHQSQGRASLQELQEDVKALRRSLVPVAGMSTSVSVGESPTSPSRVTMTRRGTLEWSRYTSCFKSGDFASACIQYRNTLRSLESEATITPRRGYCLNLNVASCYLSLGQLDEAEDAVSVALRYQPQGERATSMLAQLQEVRGDTDRARRMVEQIIARSPEQRDAWLVFVRTSPDVRELDDIPAVFRQDAGILLSFGGRLADEGRLQEAWDTITLACPYIGDNCRQSVLAAELLLYTRLRIESELSEETGRWSTV